MGREISVRSLRNHTPDVIRAVEAGEELTLTVNGRAVADIVPHTTRRRWASRETVEAILREAPADRELLDELRELDSPMDELWAGEPDAS